MSGKFSGIVLALVAVCVILVIAILALKGCGKGADRARPSDTNAVAKTQESGEVQKADCDDDLHGVFFISPATLPSGAAAAPAGDKLLVGFAVGKANTILRTVDGGKTWQRPMPRGTDEKAPEFLSVLFGSATDGWAVSRGALFHTADGGQSWTEASKLPGNFYYFGPSTVIAPGYYQMQPPTCGSTIHRTNDGGRTWDPLPGSLPRNDYETVFFLNESLGWVAGEYGHFALTQDGGKTWTEKNLPDRAHLTRIQFVNPKRGWMQTRYASDGGVLSTVDGGMTWKAQDTKLPGPTEIKDMQFLDEKTGFVLADIGSSKRQVVRTFDGGTTWTAVATLVGDLSAGCFVSPTEGWAVGPKGTIVHIKLP